MIRRFALLLALVACGGHSETVIYGDASPAPATYERHASQSLASGAEGTAIASCDRPSDELATGGCEIDGASALAELSADEPSLSSSAAPSWVCRAHNFTDYPLTLAATVVCSSR